MFKRSFSSKHRAGKTVKASQKKYDEQTKEKMKRSMEDKDERPSSGRW